MIIGIIKMKSITSNTCMKRRTSMEGYKKGTYLFGISKVGEKGQIVIPKEAREIFNIQAGDNLIVVGDVKKGLALIKAEVFTEKLGGD